MTYLRSKTPMAEDLAERVRNRPGAGLRGFSLPEDLEREIVMELASRILALANLPTKELCEEFGISDTTVVRLKAVAKAYARIERGKYYDPERWTKLDEGKFEVYSEEGE